MLIRKIKNHQTLKTTKLREKEKKKLKSRSHPVWVHLQKQLHCQLQPPVEFLFFGQFPDRARVASIPKQISTELATTLFQEKL
jgi:hypothetical protein